MQTQERTRDGKVVYGILDDEGRFISRMTLRPSGMVLTEERYYALEEDVDGFQYIRRYSVAWHNKREAKGEGKGKGR